MIIIIVAVIAIFVGVVIGKKTRKELRNNICPFCSCRNTCDIGSGVELQCDPEDAISHCCTEKITWL